MKSFFSAYKELLKLGLPVLLAQLGSIIVGQADTMMVGDYGTNELASAAFVNNLLVVPMVMQMGFAAGVTPLVGALFGAGKKLEVGQMFRVGLKLNIALGIVMSVIMGGFYFLLPYMGQDPVLLPLIRPYYLIVLGSMVVGGVFFPCMQLCNGVTDTATPMWTIIMANVINVIGNYILIYGHFGAPELGLVGAGLSTLTARTLCLVAILAVVFCTRKYRPYREGMRMRAPLREEKRKMFATSWPVMIQNGIECLLWALGAVVCGWFTKEQLAGYQVMLSISQLGFMTYMSFATAVSIKVANYTGMRDFTALRHSVRAGLHLTLLLATVASLIFYFFGHSLIHMFTDDTKVITAAMALLVPMIVYQYGDAFQMLYANALRGTGHVLPLVWISLVSYVVAGISAMYLFAGVAGLESRGVYWSFSVALFLAAWLMRRAFKRAVRMDETEKNRCILNQAPNNLVESK